MIFFTHKSILNGFNVKEKHYGFNSRKQKQEETDFQQIFEKELMKRDDSTDRKSIGDK